MAGGSRDLRYNVSVDASDASSSLRKLGSDVKKTAKDIEGSFDDSASAGDRFKATVDQLSGKLESEFRSAATAADKLGEALKKAGSDMDVGEAIGDLTRLGFTFDEITADADKFASSLKQLDDVRLAGVKELDGVAPGLATKLDSVGKSADSSKSALANMIGNSAQDLGQLGGIAGSTGVAIGQMAEYMSDAVLAGEGLSSALASMAVVAGPIAALGLLTVVLSSLTSGSDEAAKRISENSKAISDDIKSLFDNIEAPTDQLKEPINLLDQIGVSAIQSADDISGTVAAFEALGYAAQGSTSDVGNFIAAFKADSFGVIQQTLEARGKGIGLLGDQITQLIFAADSATEAIERTSDVRLQNIIKDNKDLVDQLILVRKAAENVDLDKIAKDQITSIAQTRQGVELLIQAYKNLKAQGKPDPTQTEVATELVRLYTDAAAAVDRYVLANKPVSDMQATWDDVAAAVGHATSAQDISTATQAEINKLAAEYGITTDEVLSRAKGLWDDNTEAQKAAAEAEKEAAAAALEHAAAVHETNRELDKTDDVLSTIASREDAINDVFDFTTHPIDTAKTFRDLLQAIGDDLPKAVKAVKGKIPPIIDFNDVRLDPLLDAFDDIRPDFQTKLTETFSVGGAPAATALIENLVAAMQKSTGLSREQIFQLLGLDPTGSVEATIKPFVDQSNKATVTAELDALAGGPDDNGWAAEIKAALDAGEITPQVAQALIDEHVPNGVNMPAGIEVTSEAEATAAQWAADHPQLLPLLVAPPVLPNDWGVEPPPLAVPTVLDKPSLGPWADADAGSLGVSPVSVPVTVTTALDTKDADAQLAAFIKKDRDLAPVDVTDVDTKDADAKLDAFIKKDRELAPVDVTADDTSAQTTVNNLVNQDRSTTVDVKANTAPFLKDGNAARTTIGKPITVTVTYHSDGEVHARGGTVGRRGGIAGEAGPEFIRTPNGRTSLIDGPMVLPPGTKVTSVARTRRLLSGRPATPGRSHGDLGGSRGVLRTPVAPVVTNTKTAARQLDHLVRPRTARINVALVPSSVLVRVNGGG